MPPRRPGTVVTMTTVAWWVYVVRCADGSLYTGVARDLDARLAAHNAGRGARYTRGRGPVTLVHREAAADRASAQRREAAIKRLPAMAKAALGGRAASGGHQVADSQQEAAPAGGATDTTGPAVPAASS